MKAGPLWKTIAAQLATTGWDCGFVTSQTGDKRMWEIDATRGKLHILIYSDDLAAGFLELKAQCAALELDK